MKIDNEFTVGVPIDTAWDALTDLEGIAPCLPGAQLTGVDGDVYSGKVRIKVGPVISQYAGTAQFVEKDEATHRAVIRAKGKDSRGAGNASALIDAQLRAEGDGTVVTVVTDLNISGKIAQFGSGMIKEVSVKLLGQFVENLESRLHTPDAPTAGAVSGAAPPTAVATADQEARAASPGLAGAPAGSAGTVTPVPALPSEPAPEPAPAGPATALRREHERDEAVGDEPVRQEPARQDEPASDEPLDLMSLAGGSLYKRLIPVLAAVLVVAALIVYFVVR
jgi:carbon monoxide dehydrogenase subunit G